MNWWRRLRQKGRMEDLLDKELRFHLDEEAARLIERGMDPEEARRQARMGLGGLEQVKEDCRDARGTGWVEDLWRDLTYAVRSLIRQPGFTAAVTGTLALGIGASTLMFTILNGVLMRPYPYRDAGRLLRLQEMTAKATEYGNLWAFSYPNFVDLRRESRTLDLAAWRYVGGTWSGPGEADYIRSVEVSAGLLLILGVSPAHGRDFMADEDRPGGTSVVLVSDRVWQRRLGGKPEAVGSPIVFDGRTYKVVGVLPRGFRLGDDDGIGLITLIGQDVQPYLSNRNAHPAIGVWARLRAESPIEGAAAELRVIGSRLAGQYPASNEGRTFVAERLRPELGSTGSTIWLLFSAALLVLLIGCVNVASLLVARAVGRERELAVRAALGARRGRLVRQCLTESAVLGLCGGATGVLVAWLGSGPLVTLWPGTLPRAYTVQLDWRVTLFAVGISLACGLLAGLMPALRAPTAGLETALKTGARSVAGPSRRLQRVLVAAEIALAVVLLVSAGVLGRTLLRLSSLDPGVRTGNLLVARVALSPRILGNPEQIRAAWRDALERASRIPGVQSATMVDTVPMRQGNNQLGYWTKAALPPPEQMPLALATSVTPDYLRVMGIPLRAGRFVDAGDRLGGRPVVVIDEVLAARAFGRASAIGKQLWIPAMGPPVEVVGVVGHVRYWGLAEDDSAQVRAQFYYPFAQLPDSLLRRWSELMSVAVRTAGAPLAAVEPLRREIAGPNNDQVVYEVGTMEQLAGDTLARHRFLMVLFGVFAGLALLLACIGIYGMLAYLTRLRIPEFGVRIALGASPGDVVRLVFRQSLGMIAAGAGLGVGLAVGAEGLLQRWVAGVQSHEPLTFGAMIAVLAGAALAASLIPARRAGRIDPVTALRQE